MSKCAVCDAELQPEQKTCHVCGSNVEATASTEPTVTTTAPPPIPLPPLSASSAPAPLAATPSTGERECPACGQTFDAGYQDEFCPCGNELQPRTASAATPAPAVTAIPPLPALAAPAGTTRPPVGTVCLVVYSDTKPRQPVRYVPVAKDVLLIGRQDAIRGDFPDLDLGSLLDESLAKKVSRRHAELLRARDSQTYTLRPLPGNTGTQVGKELAAPGQDYPLTDGTPIVLGGVVWMKFEVMK
ncbi:MAG: FHA domain-containing protein [Candidatus Saccharimonas sp.]|nr:FHA domain-containing protein [Planctomycetaceae bacterium]